MYEECEKAFHDHFVQDNFKCGFRAAWLIQEQKINELTRENELMKEKVIDLIVTVGD